MKVIKEHLRSLFKKHDIDVSDEALEAAAKTIVTTVERVSMLGKPLRKILRLTAKGAHIGDDAGCEKHPGAKLIAIVPRWGWLICSVCAAETKKDPPPKV